MIKYNCITNLDEINHHTIITTIIYKKHYYIYIYIYIHYVLYIPMILENNIIIKSVIISSPVIGYNLVNRGINIIFVIFTSSYTN